MGISIALNSLCNTRFEIRKSRFKDNTHVRYFGLGKGFPDAGVQVFGALAEHANFSFAHSALRSDLKVDVGLAVDWLSAKFGDTQ